MNRLLVTGVSGLLGSNLAWLASERFQVTGVLTGAHAVVPSGRAPFATIAADLTLPGQVERIVEQAQPEWIIHCAAMTDVDRCEEYPEQAAQVNTHLPALLARIAARDHLRLMHISTDAIFDGETGSYCEEDHPRPINVYARTKYHGEQLVAEACPDALIARVNFYGWSWQGRRSLAEWFYNNLSCGISVPGFTDLVFSPLLVNDLVPILFKMLDRQLCGLYHVVSSESQSKFAFGRMLAREFGFAEEMIQPASYVTAHLKAPRSKMLSLSSAKLAYALGEEMPAQLPGVRRYVELFQQGYPQSLRAMFVRTNQATLVG